MPHTKALATAEYIWLDGNIPTTQLRAKTKVLNMEEAKALDQFPHWRFDGSSTQQAPAQNSDCILKPIGFWSNHLKKAEGNHYLVLCEVFNPDNSPHNSNTRVHLRNVMEQSQDEDCLIGFEQEYVLFDGALPLGWPREGNKEPAPQGPYYCGVGTSKVYGSNVAQEHLDLCQKTGLSICGLNAEVMPGQWEFQIGYRQVKGEKADPLTVADELWIARYLLHKVAEKRSLIVSLSNKPMAGDWNGSGLHTNFSTKEIRDKNKGPEALKRAISLLEANHALHIANYGDKLEKRLTGLHETAPH